MSATLEERLRAELRRQKAVAISCAADLIRMVGPEGESSHVPELLYREAVIERVLRMKRDLDVSLADLSAPTGAELECQPTPTEPP